jgi:2-dehydro-3-deoxyphosphogluconate aldolase / (4S)-4-hydroxy-2-oxoglutarate aldolase
MLINSINAYSYLPSNKLVAVVELMNKSQAIPVCDALLSGGITAIEVTLRTPDALESIHTIATSGLPIIVGAGTVMGVDNIKTAQAVGAQFFISPVSSIHLLESASAHLGVEQHRFIPGVATATEAVTAYVQGFKVLKFFPAESSGGSAWLKSIAGPLPHIRFMPTGGVRESTLKDYLNINTVAAIGGSWIASAADIHASNWGEITNKAKAACMIADSIQHSTY